MIGDPKISLTNLKDLCERGAIGIYTWVRRP